MSLAVRGNLQIFSAEPKTPLYVSSLIRVITESKQSFSSIKLRNFDVPVPTRWPTERL